MGGIFVAIFLFTGAFILMTSYLMACAAPEKEARLPAQDASGILQEEKKAGWEMEWLAKGRHLVSILPDNTLISDFMSLGAPVDYLSPKEVRPRIATGDGSLALIKDAPHPNAAKLFANWLLSREGLLVYSKAYPAQSSRVDLPTDFLPPDEVRQPGLDYFVEGEEFLLGGNGAARVSREIFGHLLR